MINKTDLTYTAWKFHLSSEKPDINISFDDEVPLPSTVSQLKKSPVTDERSDGYLTDPHKFEGYAVYQRECVVSDADNCDVFFVMERTRTSELYIDGKYIGTENTLCGYHRYNITDYISNNKPFTLTVVINNISCPVPGGHMTSPDTQTNWLGITGEIYIETREKLRFDNIRIFPDIKSGSITVKGTVVGGESAEITVSAGDYPERKYTVSGECEFIYEMPNARLWNEHDTFTYTLKITCGRDTSETVFGMHEYSTQKGDFLLNGEKIYLRGKHDGMIFPLTGAAPTDTEGWLKVMKAAKEHGINHYRFHTCCPPDAAFRAADMLGIYMEPELPFWGTVEEEITDGQKYLIEEGFRILDEFGNHPSFFGLSLGNELWGSKERLNDILGGYKAHDTRPLYTQGSNNFQFWPCVVENDDFFVGVRFSGQRLFRGSYAMCDAPQGHIQTDAPDSNYCYDPLIRPEAVSDGKSSGGTIEIQYGTGVKTVSLSDGSGELITDIPVVSHEVGQYFTYPDYSEIEKYTGVLKPYNFEIFRERLDAAGLIDFADSFFHASGHLAADCYKAEIETALRSKELSGFQLLDIQDFTGQGTALVGVLNSFMESKGIISPEKWRCFCSEKVLLGCLPKFVYHSGEKVDMPVMLYNYSADAENDPEIKIRLNVNGTEYKAWTVTGNGSFKNGVFDIGTAAIEIPECAVPAKAELILSGCGVTNEYTLWIYPEAIETTPANITVTDDWSKAKAALSNGGRVVFMPDSISDENSIEGTYCTDFWNYHMFNSISMSMNKPSPVGTLGLLIDTSHPALAHFPTEYYSTPQWYDAVTDSRTAILDGTGIVPIVRTIDNNERNHDLGTIFEVSAGGGKLLVCTARLDKKTSSLPCIQLFNSLTEYAASDKFTPEQTADIAVLDNIFA